MGANESLVVGSDCTYITAWLCETVRPHGPRCVSIICPKLVQLDLRREPLGGGSGIRPRAMPGHHIAAGR
jgi:hypothetical protein